jgi:head-tail adaptor
METEQTTAEMVRAVTTYKITMRYRPDVTTLHRLILLGPPDLPADILQVQDPDGKRAELTLICSTGLSSG